MALSYYPAAIESGGAAADHVLPAMAAGPVAVAPPARTLRESLATSERAGKSVGKVECIGARGNRVLSKHPLLVVVSKPAAQATCPTSIPTASPFVKSIRRAATSPRSKATLSSS
jgi:hypothetical protein